MNLNFVFSKSKNLNLIFLQSMNLILTLTFTKSMNLNFAFSKSGNLSIFIKLSMNLKFCDLNLTKQKYQSVDCPMTTLVG